MTERCALCTSPITDEADYVALGDAMYHWDCYLVWRERTERPDRSAA